VKISVLIPVHNGEVTIAQAIESVLSQTIKVRQIIVVDDGSTDQTPVILAEHHKRGLIEVVGSSVQMGQTKRMNEGLRHTNGDWVARLDADDWWQPNHIEIISNFLHERQAEYSLVGTRARYVEPSGKYSGLSPCPRSEREIWCYLMKDNPFVHSGVIFRRELALEIGGYSIDVQWEDYNLWIELASRGKVAILPDITVNYRKALGKSSRVDKSIALTERFFLQRKAARYFLRRCPFRGVFFVVASWLRITTFHGIRKSGNYSD
jgi:glycosyltransferase involved in cell wall biosynthesis